MAGWKIGGEQFKGLTKALVSLAFELFPTYFPDSYLAGSTNLWSGKRGANI